MDEKILSKTMDLRGLSIYGGTGQLDGWDILSPRRSGKIDLKQQATELLVRIECSLPDIHYKRHGKIPLTRCQLH